MVEYEFLSCENVAGVWEQRTYPITTTKGIILIRGLTKACQEHVSGSDADVYSSRSFDDGRWQIRFVLLELKLNIFISHIAGDGSIGYRGGLFRWEVTMQAGKSFSNHLITPIRWFGVGLGWGESNFCATDELANNKDLKISDKIELKYVIQKYSEDLGMAGRRFLNPSMPSNLLLACRSLFNDSNTADIQFICHRGSGGRVKYIYAHSIILSSLSEYFGAMFSSGFSEGVGGISMDWSLPSDPDLDVDDLDSDCDDPDDSAHDSVETLCQYEHVVISDDEENPHNDRKYKVVEITDVPYRTYKALLYYLYTGSVYFAPLTSTYNAEKAKAMANDPAGSFIPKRRYFAMKGSPIGDCTYQWTSAKSMYALCDRLGILDLREAAALHIKSALTLENALPELFSVFSSKHDEIYKAELDFVTKRWTEIRTSSNFKRSVRDLLRHRGQDPHTAKTFRDIFEVAAS